MRSILQAAPAREAPGLFEDRGGAHSVTLEGCQIVAGGRAQPDPRKRGLHAMHPGGVPEPDVQTALGRPGLIDARVSAHHGIIPTAEPINLAAMSERERAVYQLIRDRYLVQFLPHHEFERTTVRLVCGDEVLQAALRAGHVETLMNAGAMLGVPGCGPCMGNHFGVPAAGETVISTANRNFRGRMGNPAASIYLAGPLVVAAAAVLGHIPTPAELHDLAWTGSAPSNRGNP